jgi:acyl-CoA carboxylase epsilon subunit
MNPDLRVVRGDATPEEVAALVLAVAAGARPAAAPARTASTWADRSRLLRRGASPGPGAWRASGLPR